MTPRDVGGAQLCMSSLLMLIAFSLGSPLPLAAATITADPAAIEGVYDDNRCSLHEAIHEANTPGTHSGGTGLSDECLPGSAGLDTIELMTGGIYTLTQADNTVGGATGLPRVSSPIVIEGHTATVRRDPGFTSCDGTFPEFRLFQVVETSIELRDLSLENGCATRDGGALQVSTGSSLTLTRCSLSGNSARSPNWGGAIAGKYNVQITVIESTISGNQAERGGAIYLFTGTLMVNGSTVSGNAADSFGGGIYLQGGDSDTPINRVTFNNSTISGNTADHGGGVLLRADGTTFSTLVLCNSTVTNNTAFFGGGIFAIAGAGPGAWVTSRNSIVAHQALGDDCYGSSATWYSAGYNIESGTSCGFTAGGDWQSISTFELGLKALGDYGGPTLTHALGFSSKAIDRGNPTGCDGDFNGDGTPDAALNTDQRGFGWWRPVDGNGDGQLRCDVGAIESQAIFVDGFESGDTSAWSNTTP